jgi:hypothetical protein
VPGDGDGTDGDEAGEVPLEVGGGVFPVERRGGGVLPGGGQLPLCRLRYGGSAHSFGFAIYSAAHDRYEDAVLLTGLPAGTPQDALDTACTTHLTGLGHEPGLNS